MKSNKSDNTLLTYAKMMDNSIVKQLINNMLEANVINAVHELMSNSITEDIKSLIIEIGVSCSNGMCVENRIDKEFNI